MLKIELKEIKVKDVLCCLNNDKSTAKRQSPLHGMIKKIFTGKNVLNTKGLLIHFNAMRPISN